MGKCIHTAAAAGNHLLVLCAYWRTRVLSSAFVPSHVLHQLLPCTDPSTYSDRGGGDKRGRWKGKLVQLGFLCIRLAVVVLLNRCWLSSTCALFSYTQGCNRTHTHTCTHPILSDLLLRAAGRNSLENWNVAHTRSSTEAALSVDIYMGVL